MCPMESPEIVLLKKRVENFRRAKRERRTTKPGEKNDKNSRQVDRPPPKIPNAQKE